MADQNILAHFTSGGTPAVGLSPTIRVREVVGGALVVTDASMSETGDGGYAYNFTDYDYQKDYSIRCDGGTTLSGSERYTFGGNENYVGDIWGSSLSDHVQVGTYGAELATKADIAASSSTDTSSTISGSIIYGLNTSGSYSSTIVRDNVYWVIEENASNGLTAELAFNIPDDDRAGVLRVFGRYVGTPAPTHYLELWVYNYEAAAWEKLIAIFLPGGNTSDAEYEHEYYERNIDRSNNNEVKFRIVHNVTTYNVSHSLYLDFVEVTSIEVITAEDMAIAVWDRDLSLHTTAGSAGKIVSDLEIYALRALGLMQENYYLDNNTYTDYNGSKLLTAGRIRVYSQAASVGTGSDVIATYNITAAWSNDELQTYKVVKS